jgi:hypothetical protein
METARKGKQTFSVAKFSVERTRGEAALRKLQAGAPEKRSRCSAQAPHRLIPLEL